MRYDLAALWQRTRRPRRRSVTFRPVVVPATLASDLYAEAYHPVIAAWEAAIPGIVAGYERALAEMTTDSPQDVGATLDGIESLVVAIVIEARARLQRWAARVEAVHRGKWRGAVLSATGVDISTLIGPSDARMTMGAAIERNVGLIRSVSEQARTRIGEAVFAGLNQRRPARDVAADIRKAVTMSRDRSVRIASDQLVKLNATLNQERRREAGIDTWEWRHSGKAHPREEHKARNGRRYSDDPADGAPPPNDRPGEAINCGCTERAVLSLDASDGF